MMKEGKCPICEEWMDHRGLYSHIDRKHDVDTKEVYAQVEKREKKAKNREWPATTPKEALEEVISDGIYNIDGKLQDKILDIARYYNDELPADQLETFLKGRGVKGSKARAIAEEYSLKLRHLMSSPSSSMERWGGPPGGSGGHNDQLTPEMISTAVRTAMTETGGGSRYAEARDKAIANIADEIGTTFGFGRRILMRLIEKEVDENPEFRQRIVDAIGIETIFSLLKTSGESEKEVREEISREEEEKIKKTPETPDEKAEKAAEEVEDLKDELYNEEEITESEKEEEE